MRDAVLALIDALDDDQRAQIAYPFEDDERTTWFYTPTDHGGLPLTQMTPHQQQRVFAVLAEALTPAAYATVNTIMSLDNVLDRAEHFPHEVTVRPGRRNRDPNLYYAAVFGDPTSSPWGWRFGGHHVSIHRTFVDGEPAAATPSFLGANPADTELVGGAWLRPLAVYEDLGRELVHAYPEAVVAATAPADLASGNRPFLSDGDVPRHVLSLFRDSDEHAPSPVDPAIVLSRTPRHGVTSPDLQPLVDAYAGQVPGLAIDATAMRFLWAGGVEKGEPHYYRLQSDDWLIEYDNVQNHVNHIHTVLRSWDGDFGRDALSRHHALHHS